MLFQLPPFLKCDLSLLTDFLAGLPRRVRCAFEFRHDSWFTDEVYAALRKANAALCQAESEKLETPHVRNRRFLLFPAAQGELFAARAQDTGRRGFMSLARAGDVFVYFKHEDTPEGARYAEDLLVHSQTQLGRCSRGRCAGYRPGLAFCLLTLFQARGFALSSPTRYN